MNKTTEALNELNEVSTPNFGFTQYLTDNDVVCINYRGMTIIKPVSEIVKALESQEQEPVAWYRDGKIRNEEPSVSLLRGNPKLDKVFGEPVPLYTHPAPIQEQEPVAYADDIEEMVQRLQNWCEAYPTDIFPEITKEEIDYINAQNKNLSGKYFAHVGRHFIAKGLKPALDLLLRIYNTHPAQPLSDDEIAKITEYGYADEQDIKFARAIEQAHGIK